MVSRSPHIPYPRFQTALQTRQLPFILAHSAQITMSLADEVDVCRLIAQENPDHLEPASAQWVSQFAERLVRFSQQQGLDR